MSPPILAEVHCILHINLVESFYLNIGNDWCNVTQECRIIPNVTDTSTLDFVYEGAESVDDLPCTLIFINKVLDSQLVWRGSQKLVLQRFEDGQTRVLIVTEIGGMRLNKPDITLTVQYSVPLSLTKWSQHAGCAVPMQWKLLKVKIDDEESMAYHKKIEPALHEWVETEDCWQEITDQFFDNPPGCSHESTVIFPHHPV
ncbi:hypothetical protein BS17DRAFT_769545 [Gyrodon lividus]|nr:hypothetical protein BS17DRAFT_769545 [Gyrodon lividus]